MFETRSVRLYCCPVQANDMVNASVAPAVKRKDIFICKSPLIVSGPANDTAKKTLRAESVVSESVPLDRISRNSYVNAPVRFDG